MSKAAITYAGFGLLFGVLLVGVVGCGSAESHSHTVEHAAGKLSGEYPIDVLCTTGQVGEMLERIGGKHLKVTVLMPHDVDPHTFKPRHEHVELLNSADVIFYNGLHLEGRLADLLVRRARTSPTYAVTEGIESRGDKRLREPPEFEGMYDPHVWHDVSLWADCVKDMTDTMAKLDPDHADDYQNNASAYIEELMKLHTFCQEEMAKVNEDSRVLVTAHDAFGYLGQAYGIEVFGLKGISTDEEKDLAHQETVQKMIIEREIPAVFVESIVAERTVQALVEPCRAAGWDLQIGGELYADALGAADSEASTYTGMIRHNVTTIVSGLSANAAAE